MKPTTALWIPSPWSGDENDPMPWTYWPWFKLYVGTRRARHLLGLHDDHYIPLHKPGGGIVRRCTWCGRVKSA